MRGKSNGRFAWRGRKVSSLVLSFVLIKVTVIVTSADVQDSLTHILQHSFTEFLHSFPYSHQRGKGPNNDKQQADILNSCSSTFLASSRHAAQVPPMPRRNGEHGFEDAHQTKGEEALDEMLRPSRWRFPLWLLKRFNIRHHARNGFADCTNGINPKIEERVCHKS